VSVYGTITNFIRLEVFLGSLESDSSGGVNLHHTLLRDVYTGFTKYTSFKHVLTLPSVRCLILLLAPSLKHKIGGTGILTYFPSPTPFGLGLGID
jgi:hypothetical protein